MSIYIAQLR